MKTVRGDHWYSANASLMALLRAAIAESGVRLDRRRWRTCDPEMKSIRMAGDLLLCFSSNDGWHVTAAEAREIAEKLEAALPGWIAHPRRVAYSEVLLFPAEHDEAGNPTRWIEAVPWHETLRPTEAAEAGASERSIELVRRFIAFCKKASRAGGFYVS